MNELPHRAVITASEVASYTGEDLRTVQRKAARGVYPATKLPGRTGSYLFDRAGILEVLEAPELQEAS